MSDAPDQQGPRNPPPTGPVDGRDLTAAIEKIADGVLVLDGDARVLFANPAAIAMLGRPLEHLLGQPLGFPLVIDASAEVNMLRPDGTVANADMRVTHTQWRGISAFVVALHDTTAQRQAQEQLRMWATVFESSRELILIMDARGRILAANQAFDTITGYQASEVIGRSCQFLFPEPIPYFEGALLPSLPRSGHWQGELGARRRDGAPLPLWAAISAAEGEHGHTRNYILIATDISERKAAEARIEYLAYHDTLTGLANRALLDNLIELAISRARRAGNRIGVLFVDLDRFKSVNDVFGHRAGDELLVEVAERLRACVRKEDIICRQGGDEFLILLSDLEDPTDLAAAAAKILTGVEAPFVLRETAVRLTASIGIAVYPDDGENRDDLVHNADTAMYFAKERGRNNFQFFTTELNRRVVERVSLEQALQRAVERGELELHFQPQIRSADGSVAGAEALLRWRRDGVLIQPSEFMSVAEETGIIVAIGEWVAITACRQIDEWRHTGLPPLRIAVNISARQFRANEIARLRALLSEHCSDPCSLELEMTEAVLMQDAESNIGLLRDLKDQGVSLAIDDFGTGYSSLSYLRRFPIDRLKVDQSFVREIITNSADRAVTDAIIVLARSLELRVIAEGVETREEAQLLRDRGCEELQGYYFSRPLPAADFPGWWQRWNAAGDTGQPPRSGL